MGHQQHIVTSAKLAFLPTEKSQVCPASTRQLGALNGQIVVSLSVRREEKWTTPLRWVNLMAYLDLFEKLGPNNLGEKLDSFMSFVEKQIGKLF